MSVTRSVKRMERSAARTVSKKKKLRVAMRAGDTPVPIPNTTVKTGTADGTCLETDRESRWLRDPKITIITW